MVLIFAMGFLSNDVYRSYTNHRDIDGLWLKNYNESEVNEETIKEDSLGDWVCVNINGMSFERALEVCSHEVGHEIFAEVCEKDFNKCLGILN